jgi:hypothetical protein
VFDIIIVVLFWLSLVFVIIDSNLIIFLGVYLVCKGLAFIINFNITSSLDIFSGMVIITNSLITLPIIIPILIVLFLLQKGVLSLK